MINKQNLWFVTLFSIILVLSIFYLSMNESNIKSFIDESTYKDEESTLVVNENTELVALRVESDEKDLNTMNELKQILLSESSTINEKNDAYNELLQISNNKGNEENLEKILKKDFGFDSFVKINSSNITIVIDNKDHDYELANNIIRRIQQEFKEDKYITVKFN